MKKIIKGYIFRIYPTEKQIELIEKSFGCSRYIYNYFLRKKKKYINSYESIKKLPNLIKVNSWLKEVDSCLLRCSIFNLEDSFKKYNKKISRYPKFKSKTRSRASYRTNNIISTYKGKTYESISVDLEKRTIKLSKLKQIKIKGLNRWLQRSKNRYKIIKKLQTVYRKLKNTRKYLLHQISNKLTKENDVIVTEKLKISEMVQNKKFYQIETYYSSSQICSRCGYQEKKVKDLRIRKWECPSCTNVNKRDINASINIMVEGLKMYIQKNTSELQVI